MKIAIDKIKVAERIRKEITRIPELAEDMKMNGLLNPVTVMRLDDGEFRLLAGLRRIKAAQLLGWSDIEVNILTPSDAEAMLQIEISENEQREQFTFSEKMYVRLLLEEIETLKARERMSLGGKCGLEQGKDGRPYLVKKQSRDAIGEQLGMSGRQYDRAKYVADNATPEMIEQLDKGERSISGTYEELRAKEKTALSPAPVASDETDPGPVPHPLPVVPKTQAETPDQKPSACLSSAKEERAVLPPTPIVSAIAPELIHKSRTEEPKPQAEAPDQRLPTRTNSAKKDPNWEKLEAQQMESFSKWQEFDALPPDEKIIELQRQLKEARGRANSAECSLARERENRKNSESHLQSTIKMLQGRLAMNDERDATIESLRARLEAAEARIAELEGAAAKVVNL